MGRLEGGFRESDFHGVEAVLARLLVVTIVALSACTPKEVVKPGREGTDARTIRGHLTVRASGAVAVDFDGEVDLRIVTVLPHEKKLRFLSVGILELQEISTDERFKAALDLVGVYGGRPGEFTIPAAQSEVPTLTATPVTDDDPLGFSNALLQYFRLKDPAKPLNLENLSAGHDFNVAVEPCAVRVTGELESSGSLVCPKLKDPAGNVIRLEMRWKVDPEATPTRD